MSHSNSKKKKISVICPVFNEENTISLYYERFQKAISCLKDRYHVELIFVNNCSEDNTLSLARNLHSQNSSVQVISLTRNFGYQASVLCGLSFATGDAVVVNDVDGEDPPELIPKFVDLWEKGYDIIYGKREKRPEFLGLTLCRKLFYRFTRAIADNDFILDMAEFSLFTRQVRREVLKTKTSFPFIRNELAYVGFRQIGVPYNREKRIGGKGNYIGFAGMFRMFQFAVAGILTASTFPLRLTFYLGVPLLLINFLVFFLYFLIPEKVPFPLIYILNTMFLIAAVIFLSTYMARVYKNGIRRPIFIVDWENTVINTPSHNFSQSK
ncbi:MAG: glycosyltransferase family 2 protein [Nitrospina sp.]|nr:glycosyltransferase family 2 protein [Nitrospina sp.]